MPILSKISGWEKTRFTENNEKKAKKNRINTPDEQHPLRVNTKEGSSVAGSGYGPEVFLVTWMVSMSSLKVIGQKIEWFT